MTTLNKPRIIELLALSDQATKGPWCVESIFGDGLTEVCLGYEIPSEGSPILLATTYGEDGRVPSAAEAERNAAFIAAAPELAEQLRLAVERMSEMAEESMGGSR